MSRKVYVDIVETRIKTLCVLVDEFDDDMDVEYNIQTMYDTNQIDMLDAVYDDHYIDVNEADDDAEVDLDLTRHKELEDDVMDGVNVTVDADGVYHIKTSVIDVETSDIDSNTEFDADAVINAVLKAYYGDDVRNIGFDDMLSIGLLIHKNIHIINEEE